MRTSIAIAFSFALLFTACNQEGSGGEGAEEAEIMTGKAEIRDIVKKTVANGSIEPRREVAMKSQVSGILDQLYKEAGDQVKKGEVIARIKIIPNPESLNQAQAGVNTSRIRLENAEKEYKRQKDLFDRGVTAEQTFRTFEFDYQLAKENLATAISNLEIIKEGAAANSSEVLNEIRSTIDGLILDIPVKEGSNVIESNNFNEGTSIATVADMADLIFIGTVDESEVGKISEGMPIELRVGAIEKQVFNATLEYISPKGKDVDGTIQFEIKASVELKEGIFLRAGYSANANIVLDRRDQVLCINEANLVFEKGKPYVEVKKGAEFEKTEVKLGLSDGIYIEVLEGMDADTEIKVSSTTSQGKRRGWR